MKKYFLSMEGYQHVVQIRFDSLPKPGYSPQKDTKKQLNTQPPKKR